MENVRLWRAIESLESHRGEGEREKEPCELKRERGFPFDLAAARDLTHARYRSLRVDAPTHAAI